MRRARCGDRAACARSGRFQRSPRVAEIGPAADGGTIHLLGSDGAGGVSAGRGSTCGRIRISVWRLSPICSKARSITATASARRRRSRPGDVNWMTAGTRHRPIPSARRRADGAGGRQVFGIQSWVALPAGRMRRPQPGFEHHAAEMLPRRSRPRAARARSSRVRCLAQRSPVRTLSEMFYADVQLRAGRARAARRRPRGARRSMLLRERSRSPADAFEAAQASGVPPGRLQHYASGAATQPRRCCSGASPWTARAISGGDFVSSAQ